MILITPDQFDHHFRCVGEPDTKFSTLFRMDRKFGDAGTPGDLYVRDGDHLSLLSTHNSGHSVGSPVFKISSESDRVQETLSRYNEAS